MLVLITELFICLFGCWIVCADARQLNDLFWRVCAALIPSSAKSEFWLRWPALLSIRWPHPHYVCNIAVTRFGGRIPLTMISKWPLAYRIKYHGSSLHHNVYLTLSDNKRYSNPTLRWSRITLTLITPSLPFYMKMYEWFSLSLCVWVCECPFISTGSFFYI